MHVGIDATGKPVSVSVDEQLVLHGVGDFDLKIPGPALDVSAPPDEPNQPGLRRGSVVWAGFSGGTKTLTAHVTLNPDIEDFKLPLGVTVSGTEVRIENRTALPVPVTDGNADPGSVARVADAVRAGLAGGGRPTAGAGGIPSDVPGSPGPTTSVPVLAPFHVVGTVDERTFDAIIPGPQAPDGVLTVPASEHLQFTATPSAPDAPSVTSTLRSVQIALWQVLRIGDVAAYLGNPFPGTSNTTYTYETVAPARTAPAVRAVQRAKPFAIVLALLAALAVVVLSGLIWARN